MKKSMNPEIETAITVSLIAIPAFVFGFLLAARRARKRRDNRYRYPYSISR